MDKPKFTGFYNGHGILILIGDSVQCECADGISRPVVETVKGKSDPGRTNTLFNCLPIGWNGMARWEIMTSEGRF